MHIACHVHVTCLVFSHALRRCPATHPVSATCVVHSVLASLVHSLCNSAADPLSDLEGMRRAATGECELVVCGVSGYAHLEGRGGEGRCTHSARVCI